jgi:hypothetical protein
MNESLYTVILQFNRPDCISRCVPCLWDDRSNDTVGETLLNTLKALNLRRFPC